MSYLEVLEKARDLYLAHIPFCSATIVEGQGSIPQILGAKALFTEEGLVCGTVGGGHLEKQCEEMCREMLSGRQQSRTQLVKLNLQRDLAMTCGGEVTVFLECQGSVSDWTIAIFGAGHVAQALCRLLVSLDCRILVFDTRSDWLAALPASPRLTSIRISDMADGAKSVPTGADIVIMTIGHAEDARILKSLAMQEMNFPYIGVIGSRAKSLSLRKMLNKDGVPESFVSDIICPIGEKIGNNTPAEIALGIASQLLKRRRSES
ncbi:MAG: XdhC family protein [Alphaproteobacteria bacterium]|nr:XdhC family protein [Alphaproteobacteria bacterium]